MKKLVILTLATTMSMSTLVFANSPMKPIEKTEVTAVTPSIIIDMDTHEELVPAREFAESIGYEVIWNDSLRSITFTKGNNIFTAYIDSNVYESNAGTKTLNTKTKINKDKAYIPVSFKKMLIDIPQIDPMPITPEVPIVKPIIPIENTVDPIISVDVAKSIASIIDEKILELTNEQLKANEEYKNNFLANGGNINDYSEPVFEVDYEFLSHNSDYVSVKVYKNQSLVLASSEETYYTFDSQSGNIITLEDHLGVDYSSMVKESILKTAKEREEFHPETYNYDEKALKDLVIDENTSFYFSENDEVIVVFDKYKIADGKYGKQEFVVSNISK